MFIAFEGGDGSGKGTQITLLENRLKKLGYKVLVQIEPGGTALGIAIREILLNREELRIDPMTEAFLFTACRVQEIAEKTRAALKEGCIVISDRSFYSTYAYQGYGRGLNLSELKAITKIAVQDIVPDLVFLLDISPSLGIKRKRKQDEVNRMEKEKIKFHQRVRSGYFKLARLEKKKWRIISAKLSVSDIAEYVWKETLKQLR